MKPTQLPLDHTESESAIDVNDDLQAAIAKDEPVFEELMSERRKLIAKVDRWKPVESVEDAARMQDAKQLRLSLVKVRTGLDAVRKKVGELYHKRWKATNDLFRPLLAENEQAEDYLRESEEYAIRAEASRKAELKEERSRMLAPYLDPTPYPLGEMDDAAWTALFVGAKIAAEKAQKEAAEKEAEEKRQREADKIAKEAAEKALADERALNALVRSRERAVGPYTDPEAFDFAAMTEEEFQNTLETVKSLHAIQVAEQAAAAKAQEEEAAELKKAKDAAQALADAEKAKADALEQAENDRKVAAEAAEKEAQLAAEKAARAPDKEKLKAYFDSILRVVWQPPKCDSAEARDIIKDFETDLVSTMQQISVEIEAL